MRTALAVIAAVPLIVGGAAFVAASDQVARKPAAPSMVVYKSPT